MKKKKFIEELSDESKRNFSVNFLLAELEKIIDIERDERILNNRLKSTMYQNGDFSTYDFYKNISKVVEKKELMKGLKHE